VTKKFEGIDIKEVWDYRLSKAVPFIDRTSGTWVVKVYSKENPDYDGKNLAQPLESYDTGIKSESGDQFDTEKVKKCYEWMYTVRDKYSLEDIEERKPQVAKIREIDRLKSELNEKLAKMGA